MGGCKEYSNMRKGKNDHYCRFFSRNYSTFGITENYRIVTIYKQVNTVPASDVQRDD